MHNILEKSKLLLIYIYILWQTSELIFQYSLFQKFLTDIYAKTETPMKISVSNTTYASTGAIRYICAIVFASLLAKYLFDAKKAETSK
jgi:hypothetical protein